MQSLRYVKNCWSFVLRTVKQGNAEVAGDYPFWSTYYEMNISPPVVHSEADRLIFKEKTRSQCDPGESQSTCLSIFASIGRPLNKLGMARP